MAAIIPTSLAKLGLGLGLGLGLELGLGLNVLTIEERE